MSRCRLNTMSLRAGCSVLRRISVSCAITALLAVSACADLTTASTAPVYTAAGIVQAASQMPGTLAPNTIATMYGTNLSWTTHALATSDLNGGTLPTSLEGVTVYVNGISSSLFFVSPGQVNFLIPYEIVGSSASVYVVRQGVLGPTVTIALATASPGFFQWDGNFAIAAHADGSLITQSSPAQGGEVIVLYAAGLGRTSPDMLPSHVASMAVSILYLSQLQVLLNGVACPPSSILYAGVTPGFAGLYQINLQLPSVVGTNPSIQAVMGAQASPASVQLFAQ